MSNMRIGHGYDVHRFADQFDENKPLVLAGVTLDEKRSLLAHSDGDLVLHAICDALLGAIAGISSVELLSMVLDLLLSKNMQVVNIDVTVVAQVPKLSDYRKLMVAKIADLLSIPDDRVNLKATTTEGLGPIGREEGLACHAVTLLVSND